MVRVDKPIKLEVILLITIWKFKRLKLEPINKWTLFAAGIADTLELGVLLCKVHSIMRVIFDHFC